MTAELTMLYVHGESIGYGRLGVELAKQLTARGVEMYDHLAPPADVAVEMSASDHLVADGRRSKLTNTVCWISVPTHARGWWTGQYTSIFTMWEAHRLPESFRETLHEFDLVIVPSPHNVELFSKYHDNVKLVLLGVDPEQWHYVPRTEPGLFFDFLIGGSGPRKGVDLAMRAFRKLWRHDGSWGDGPIPRLVMKSPRGDTSCNGVYLGGDRTEIISGRLEADDEIALYERSHCYLQPARGEGFGLQPLQAIAQGIPTILTNAHGHESFAHLGYGIGSTPTPAAYFIYGDAGEWWEPSFDDLCERMEFVYNNYDEACARAKMAARVVARDWTWGHTAAQFVRAHGNELAVPYCGDHSWHRPVERLYAVATNRDWHADIGGISYFFKQGAVYHEPADVKRILFEAGLLDPSCLTDDDPGLAPEQVARIGAYRARNSNCPTCGQELNTSMSRADALYAEMVR